MRLDHLLAHLDARVSRRAALGIAAKAGAAGALAHLGLSGIGSEGAIAAPDREVVHSQAEDPEGDEMFDVEAVENGAWVPGPYGPGDQRGSFNEVTPGKTAEALRMLDADRDVVTYQLGDLLFNGYPAFVIAPPRIYDQRLTVLGYVPPPTFVAEGGILQSPVPLGPNRISAHEERFPLGGTYQIATQLDNLNHVGVGDMFYNGFTGPNIAAGHGTTKLGNEHMGPLVTRGIVLDVIGLKVARGESDTYFTAANGNKVLDDNYRITVEDIEASLERQGIDGPTPGDVVLFRTGWGNLVREDPDRYLANEPGIYLREARFLGRLRPAIIGGDTWALETLDEEVNEGNLFPVHQELFMRFGIRIGEGMLTDGLAEDGIFEFVFVVTPQFAEGATAGNTPPAGLATPRRAEAPAAPFAGDPETRVEGVPLPATGGGAAAAGAAAVAAGYAGQRALRKRRPGGM